MCPAMALSCPGAAHVPQQVATVTSRPFLWVSSYQQLNSSCQQDSGCAMPSRNRGGRGFVSFGLRTLQHIQRHEQVSSVPRTQMADTRGGCGQGSLTIWAITECWFDKRPGKRPTRRIVAAAENEPTSQKRCFPLPTEWVAEGSSSHGPNQLPQENHPWCTQHRGGQRAIKNHISL